MSINMGSIWYDAVGVLVAGVLLAVLCAKYSYTYWKRQGVPFMEPVFPFGNTKAFILKTQQVSLNFQEIYKYFKGRKVAFGGFYFMCRPELMIVDPVLIKQVLVKDFDHFDEKGTFVDERNDPLTANLFSIGGVKWRRMRAKLTPTFTSGKMKMMFQTLVATSSSLLDVVAEVEGGGEPLEVREILARFATDVIGSCAFGIECNSLKTPDTDFRKYGAMIFYPRGLDVLRTTLAVTFPAVCRFLRVRFIKKNISDFLMNIIRETVKYREINGVYRADFMHLLLQLKNQGQVTGADETENVKPVPDGTNLTMTEIGAHCFVFFAAGFETSSTTMTFCLLELAQNPEIQDKLRMEIVHVLSKHNGELTYDAIMEMKYMDQVVSETLRKYPALGFLIRKCSRDYRIPNTSVTIRKGQIVRVSILGLHHDPDYYPEPETFDPERFSKTQKNGRPPYTYMPFGEGPRICIGLRFGLMETKVGLTVLLRSFKFSVNGKTQIPLMMDPYNLILSVQGGVWLDVHKLTPCSKRVPSTC